MKDFSTPNFTACKEALSRAMTVIGRASMRVRAKAKAKGLIVAMVEEISGAGDSLDLFTGSRRYHVTSLVRRAGMGRVHSTKGLMDLGGK